MMSDESSVANHGIHETIVALEQAALDRWCQGDPSGFLEISAPDVVYFDPFLGRRLDGLSALTDYYESIRGTVSAEGWQIVRPLVQVFGPVAVLTFDFESWGGSGAVMRWHCTEAYRDTPEGWRIFQTHWSFAAKTGTRD